MQINKIQAERILSPTQISIAPYTINPYRGCPFACLYCYAKEHKAIKKRNEPWGTFIDIKTNAVELLKKEIKGKKINRVLLGSTVECYPPQEKEFNLTSQIIDLLNTHNIAVTILTKSPLIQRDLDLISKHKDNKIYLTINFASEQQKNLLEPLSPPIAERIDTLKQISIKNINNRVHIAPLIPFIQNIEEIATMVLDYSQELSVELYNFKMGNWETIGKIIKENSPNEFQRTQQIISNEENYKKLVHNLQLQVNKLNDKLKKKIIFLNPNYDDYYRKDIKYE